LIVLRFAFLSSLTTHITNIHAPSVIRTRNPNKRYMANPHCRSPDCPARNESLYRLSYSGPRRTNKHT
jgi:hypothetical protein